MPVMIEVQVNPVSPLEAAEQAEEKKENMFEFGQSNAAFYPNTIDIGHHLKQQAPDELFMTDTNLLEMRVPNFSYTGDI